MASNPRSANTPGEPLLGKMLGDCRLESVLGQGGMGTVYRAHHLALDKPVAVKVLSPLFSMDDDYRERFLLEARAAAKLEHPNIVQVFGCHADDRACYIILQLVAGQSLEQLLEREKRLDLPRATRIARDVAAGLAVAHAAGVVHRDIKPGNVLLTREEVAKIADFGLARNLKQKKGLTVEGTMMGTPEYMAPEQAEGRAVDARADLYSLGVMYYRMLAGKLPFDADSPLSLAAKQIRDEPAPLEEVVKKVDPRAAALAHRLLRKKPEDRYQEARQVVAELEAILAGPARETRRRAAGSPPVKGGWLPFWAGAGVGGLFAFAAGAMGASAEAGPYVASLMRPFAGPLGQVLWGLLFAALAGAAFVVGIRRSRRELAAREGAARGVVLVVGAGLALFAAGVHAPPAAGAGPVILRAVEGLFAVWPHPVQLGLAAGFGLWTALVLLPSRRRALSLVILLTSLAAAAGFAALWGSPRPQPLLKQGVAYWLAGTAGLACALVGLHFLIGRSDKALGSVLVALGAGGLYAFGVPPGGTFAESVAAPLRAFPEAFVRHGGTLTLAAALAGWAGWALHGRR